MVAWKHKNWKTFNGTWYVASDKLSDEDIQAIIASDPGKYGPTDSWVKVI